MKAHQWAFNVFKEWNRQRNGSDRAQKYTENDLWSEDAAKVCEMLTQFVLEARQSNGKPYTPKSILQLMINLQGLAFQRTNLLVIL